MTEASGADVRAYDEARAAGDVDAMAAAALRLVGTRIFGTVPGRLPAFLHEAYALSQGQQRLRLAIAIARVWAYGGAPERAEPFVAEALAGAEEQGDPTLLAQALDAQLLVRWGPDDYHERSRITARLEDTVAHVSDVDARLSAYLWRLTTALEALDVATMRRQLRALEQLAEESRSGRVRLFAASRRAMHALLVGDLDLAERMRREAVAAGQAAGEPDAYAIDRTLTASIARQADDQRTLRAEASLYEEFGEGEGVVSVAAEAAQLWMCVGEADRAARLLHQLAGTDFGHIKRDLDWMLTVTALTDVAADLGEHALAAQAVQLLRPYAGRGVVNAGAVGFAGVVDHYIAKASDVIGADDAGEWWSSAAAMYRRVGATRWLERCRETSRPSGNESLVLRPLPGGAWEVGRQSAVSVVRDMKGLHYLRLLLQRPGLDVASIDLSDAVAGHPDEGIRQAPLPPPLDRAAAAAYRRRLAELDQEMDELEAAADTTRAARLEHEREALLHELRAAAGLGGRPRPSGGSGERARMAVRKAVAAALAKVTEVDPPTGRLLSRTVTTGSVCRYDPDPDRPTSWLLD